MRFTADDYMALSAEKKQEVNEWLLAHGFIREHIMYLDLTQWRAVSTEMVMRNGFPSLNKRKNEVRTLKRGVNITYPFPLELP